MNEIIESLEFATLRAALDQPNFREAGVEFFCHSQYVLARIYRIDPKANSMGSCPPDHRSWEVGSTCAEIQNAGNWHPDGTAAS